MYSTVICKYRVIILCLIFGNISAFNEADSCRLRRTPTDSDRLRRTPADSNCGLCQCDMGQIFNFSPDRVRRSPAESTRLPGVCRTLTGLSPPDS